MTDVTIHPARPRDLPDLQEMIRALSAHHGDAAPVTLSFLQEHLFDSGRACAFLARAGEAPLGHAACTRQIRLNSGQRFWDVQQLYVAPIWRGRGVGRALLDRVAKAARDEGAEWLTIGTAPDNLAAQAAYRALEWEEVTGPGPRFRRPL